jgi:CheY-like chemotaxis protein
MVSDIQNRAILLVEDNPNDADLALRALKKNNIHNEIVVATDGVEALDYLFGTGGHAGRDTGDVPVVVLLDLKLPKIDGVEVLKRIRADPRTKYLPVIMLTSSLEDRDVFACYDCGANSYVRKPVDFTDFTEAVRELGLYWLVLNVCPSHPRPDR